jgi:hypothetical protein
LRRGAALLLTALALLTIAGCAGRPREERLLLPEGAGGRMLQPRVDPNANYTQGIELKNAGNCKGAIEKLRPVANMGPGYENAQTALGSCLLIVGASSGEMTRDYMDGMVWLHRAADAGFPEAQGVLAKEYLQGPETQRNGAEAAYWLTLYEVNSGKARVGFVGISDAEVAAMERALSSADKAAGVKRAQQWQRRIWLPPPQQPGAGPGERPGQGNGGPPRGGPRRRPPGA